MFEFSKPFYRESLTADTSVISHVRIESTDLIIRASCDCTKEAAHIVEKLRSSLRIHIDAHPDFLPALDPLECPPDVPEFIQNMYHAARLAGVGPMAAVAGSIAEETGRLLLPLSPSIAVENGGDIWLSSHDETIVSIFAGSSPLNGKIALKIPPGSCGICTSSGTIGPSLSFGKADAATIIAHNAALADAAASALGNRIQDEHSIEEALAFVLSIPGVTGALVIYREFAGAQGDIELTYPLHEIETS